MIVHDIISLFFTGKRELSQARLPAERFRATNAVVDLRLQEHIMIYNYGVADFLITDILAKKPITSCLTLPLLLRSGETVCLTQSKTPIDNEYVIIGFSLNDMQYIHAFYRTVRTGVDEYYHFLRNDLCSSTTEYVSLSWHFGEPLFDSRDHVYHRVVSVPGQSVLLLEQVDRLGFRRIKTDA